MGKHRSDEAQPVNLSVLRGPCSGPPEVRRLESGRRLATLAIRVPAPGAGSTSVPVTVWEPPAWVEGLDAGDDVLVLGCVRRRFFGLVAGGTGARVDVEAEAIARAGDRRRAGVLRRRAEEALAALE